MYLSIRIAINEIIQRLQTTGNKQAMCSATQLTLELFTKTGGEEDSMTDHLKRRKINKHNLPCFLLIRTYQLGAAQQFCSEVLMEANAYMRS